jgi:predicted acyl esterase
MLSDDLLNGGIPNIKFLNFICGSFRGNNCIEDVGAMLMAHPYMNEYWGDKRAELEKINCPAYFTASYSNALHTRGTFQSFSKIASQEKWLRVHNTHEWNDFYKDEIQADLMRFMDCYLKGIDNGWKSTPKVRLSVLDPGGIDIVNRPEEDWPLPQMQPVRFYLSLADRKLAGDADDAEQSILIDAPDKPLTFELVFSEYTEIIGPAKLLLWVEAIDCNDVEINASFYKADPDGNPLPTYHNYAGPENILRASRRDLDPKRSTLLEPRLSFEKFELLSPGEVVPVEIGLWPTGLVFRAGERLVLKIRTGILDSVVPGSVAVPKSDEFPGSRVFHCGGKYDSQLVLPVVR